jgi:integrase
VFAPPKSQAGYRTLAMPEQLSAMLVAHLSRQGLTGADPDALVFVSPEGGPLRYDRWRRRVWLPALRKAGLEGLTFHDLRRTNETAMVQERVDIKTAHVRAGHSDPRLTIAVYTQETSEANRAVPTVLGRHFFEATNDARAMDAR